jgi:hypothetical protein
MQLTITESNIVLNNCIFVNIIILLVNLNILLNFTKILTHYME